jgi:hypothetical protein
MKFEHRPTLIRTITCLVAALILPMCGTEKKPTQEGDEIEELTSVPSEDRPAWKGTARIRVTGSLKLDLSFNFIDTPSPLRGPGLVHLIFENEPYALEFNGSPGNPTSEDDPMIILLSNGEGKTISGKPPECTYTFSQPGPDAIVGDGKCTGLENKFSEAGGTIDLETSLSIGP